MPKKPAPLAKLTRPRLYKAVARERLFRLLDEKREHPVVWIVGPPGAGKTTLAASYLEEAGLPAIWYQMDSGDSDPATFFYYLRQAVEALAKTKKPPLPLLTPEYVPDLEGFSRRFLRDALRRLPANAAVVLDNYHDIAENSGSHSAIAAALLELPATTNTFVLSRTEPPPAFAALRASRALAIVSSEDLRMTNQETVALAMSRGVTQQEALQNLHEQCNGWMAGVTLMLERLRIGESFDRLHRTEALGAIFDYFAGLIFNTASEQMQHVLMKTALLPWVNAALADCIADMPDSIKYLEELHRRHLFTDRRYGEEPTFVYHALFRAFLKSKATSVLTEEVRLLLVTRAAQQLRSLGHVDEAFAMFVEVGEWAAAERLVLDSASSLISQGRWQTLGQWIETLPSRLRDTNPWLQYWLGRSRIFVDSVAVRPILEAAFQTFHERGDSVGQLLCATTILEGLYIEFDNIKPMDPWIERLVALLQAGVRPFSNEDELRAHSAVMMGATFRAPRHSMLETCVQRVCKLLSEPFDANTKLAVASVLLGYSNVSMDRAAEKIAVMVAHPILESAQWSRPLASSYWNAEGYTHYIRGRYAQALACFDEADAVATKRVGYYSVLAGFRRGLCQRRAGLLAEAEETLLRIEKYTTRPFGHEAAGLDLLRGGIAFDRGNTQQAIDAVLRSYQTFEESGHFNAIVLVGSVAANMAVAAMRLDVATKILTRLRAEPFGLVADNYLAPIVLNQAWLAHRRGDIAKRNDLLRETLRRASDERGRARLGWYKNAMAELLPLALSEGIDTALVESIAREFAVVPAPADLEHWPWPIKIYTLGRFELLLDGKRPEFSRKVPKKVLLLLKAIIAYGGSDVAEQKLIDALWPDVEGDAAGRALGATLHRLRNVLGDMKAITQSGGELSLNQQLCWTDSRAFESLSERAHTNSGELEKSLALYRGTFLPNEENAAWAVPLRERLRARFIHAVVIGGSALEASSGFEAAIELYSRGIEADNLVEPFYQGLMRCYEKLDRRTEAMSAYRRLRQILSITLGVTPSSATQRQYESLRLN